MIHSSGINKTNNSRKLLLLQFVKNYIRTQEDLSLISMKVKKLISKDKSYKSIFESKSFKDSGKEELLNKLLGSTLNWEQYNKSFNSKIDHFKWRIVDRLRRFCI